MSWNLIPWSESIHKKMTYRRLLEQLQTCPTETLDKEVMLYSIAKDEFIPAYMTDYTIKESAHPDHLVITF
jgi:hypothetical protein